MCRGMQVSPCECVCVWVTECVCEYVCVCVCECVSERVCMFSQYQVMIGQLQADVDFKERWLCLNTHRSLKSTSACSSPIITWYCENMHTRSLTHSLTHSHTHSPHLTLCFTHQAARVPNCYHTSNWVWRSTIMAPVSTHTTHVVVAVLTHCAL